MRAALLAWPGRSASTTHRSPDAVLEAFADRGMRESPVEELLRTNRRAMPVVDGGRLVGIVTIGDISTVPADARATTPVSAVMSGGDGLRTVRPGTSLTDALRVLSDGDYDQLPVTEDGTLLGMLSRADVIRQLQLREALEVER